MSLFNEFGFLDETFSKRYEVSWNILALENSSRKMIMSWKCSNIYIHTNNAEKFDSKCFEICSSKKGLIYCQQRCTIPKKCWIQFGYFIWDVCVRFKQSELHMLSWWYSETGIKTSWASLGDYVCEMYKVVISLHRNSGVYSFDSSEVSMFHRSKCPYPIAQIEKCCELKRRIPFASFTRSCCTHWMSIWWYWIRANTHPKRFHNRNEPVFQMRMHRRWTTTVIIRQIRMEAMWSVTMAHARKLSPNSSICVKKSVRSIRW